MTLANDAIVTRTVTRSRASNATKSNAPTAHMRSDEMLTCMLASQPKACTAAHCTAKWKLAPDKTNAQIRFLALQATLPHRP